MNQKRDKSRGKKANSMSPTRHQGQDPAQLHEKLKRLGKEVFTLREGLNQRDYDLIVSDLKMPEVNGQELFLFLRQTNPTLGDQVLFSHR